LISFASQLILRGALRGDTTLPDLPRHGKKRAGSSRRAGHAHIIVDLTYGLTFDLPEAPIRRATVQVD
jgi:hypothetical protein